MPGTHKSKKRSARVAIEEASPDDESTFDMMSTLSNYFKKFTKNPSPQLQLLQHSLREPTQQYLEIVENAVKAVKVTDLSSRIGEEKALRKVEKLDDKLRQEPTIGKPRRKRRSPLETYEDIRERRQIARSGYRPGAKPKKSKSS